ncbi:MAG TPA: hypothetical protein DDW65_07090 [Firmicutes bacterium]|jgi:uncharacterized protein (TIGR02145 family)|nr:hypothetical protein [Bacillota bacterium]
MKKTVIVLFLTLILAVSLAGCGGGSGGESPDKPTGPTGTMTVTDIDGNVYHTITIGSQTWMKENLRTTKYNDGVAISNITDATAWWQTSVSTTIGAYCNYNNNAANANVYGKIYNWNVVSTGKLCPPGWHVPTNDEWDVLQNYLIANGYNYDNTTTGNKIGKSLAYTSGWNTSSETGDVGNNQISNNSSGFTALPGGYRDDNGVFDALGRNCFFWTSTGTSSSKYANYKNISYLASDLYTNYMACGYCGFYVRCIKD